jgi:hypothetical protein
MYGMISLDPLWSGRFSTDVIRPLHKLAPSVRPQCLSGGFASI